MSERLRWEYDRAVNCGYVSLAEGQAARTVPVDDAVNLDYDADGRLLGVEILGPVLPDWVEDESLSREETLARFAALHPKATRGPRTTSFATSVTLTWPETGASNV